MNNGMHIWHPFTQEATDPPPVKIVRAHGAYLFTADGRRLIDAISSWWTNIHGHGHPAITDAIAAQAERLDHVLLAGFTHEAVESMVHWLRRFTPPALDHVFFSDDGSTAVEVALKMALQYWQNVGRPEKKSIVGLEHAYHGDTVGAMSVGDGSAFTEAFKPFLFPVRHVHAAYCYRCPVGKTRDACSIDCVQDLARLLEQNGEQIAAVIVEPLLQGAGGMIVHPVEFLQKVRALCSQHDVLLIADEVLTGFGRTGKMFACELAEVTPDLMCLSKGITGGVLAMGATLCTGQIHAAFRSDNRSRTFWHGHSYTGNPIAAAAAAASLKIFAEEPVFDRIMEISAIHEGRLAKIKGHVAVGDVRSIGTVAAIELRTDDVGYFSNLKPMLYQFFVESGVLLRPLGNIVYVLPPYVITPRDLNFVHDVIAQALDRVASLTLTASERLAQKS